MSEEAEEPEEAGVELSEQGTKEEDEEEDGETLGEDQEEAEPTPSEQAKIDNPWWHPKIGYSQARDLDQLEEDRALLRQNVLEEMDWPWLTTIVFITMTLLMILNDFVSKATTGGDLPNIGKPLLGSHKLADGRIGSHKLADGRGLSLMGSLADGRL